MKLVVLCIAFATFMMFIATAQCVMPGFRVITTQKALDYVNEIGFPLLKKTLSNLTIPSMSYPYKKGIINVNFTISNVVIASLNFGDPSLTSNIEGVVLNDEGISMSLTADWSYVDEDWPYFKDHGTVDISASDITLDVSIGLTRNKTSGGIHLTTTSCSFTASNFDVHFHGGDSWLYNIFDSLIEVALRSYINNQACSSINDKVNTSGNALAESLKVVYPVIDGIEVDYSLVSDPDFTHKGYIITNHKGEFLQTTDPQDPPFIPDPLPDTLPSNYTSEMVYVQVTPYVFESASYAFWKAGLLAYNISNDQLPAGFDTTSSYCCGIVPEELCKKYPDMKVMFGVVASDYPRLYVTTEYAAMHAKANVSMYVDNEGKEEIAFTLALDVKADVNVSLKYNTSAKQYYICGKISNPKIKVSLAKSSIGKFNCSALEKLIKAIAPTLGLALINKYIGIGFPIPVLDGVSLTDMSLIFRNGYLEVGGDVAYSPECLKKLYNNWLQ